MRYLSCLGLACAAALGFTSVARASIQSNLPPRSLDTVQGLSSVPNQVSPHLTGVLWDNLPQAGENVTSTGSTPRTGGADEMIMDGNTALITSMRFGYGISAGGPAAFDVRFRFWDDIDFNATTTAQFSNLKADFTVPLTGQVAGAFLSGSVNLTTLPGGGVSLTDNAANGFTNLVDTYIEMDFYQPGTTTPVAANAVTYLFRAGGAEPVVGYTFGSAALGGTQVDDLYWRDANASSSITADEGRSFAAPTRANWTVQLSGTTTLVPEPATFGILATGVLLTLARRRRA